MPDNNNGLLVAAAAIGAGVLLLLSRREEIPADMSPVVVVPGPTPIEPPTIQPVPIPGPAPAPAPPFMLPEPDAPDVPGESRPVLSGDFTFTLTGEQPAGVGAVQLGGQIGDSAEIRFTSGIITNQGNIESPPLLAFMTLFISGSKIRRGPVINIPNIQPGMSIGLPVAPSVEVRAIDNPGAILATIDVFALGGTSPLDSANSGVLGTVEGQFELVMNGTFA